MKSNNFKRVITVLLAVVCICCVLALVACHNDEQNNYATLTLQPGNGGSIKTSKHQVEVGANVAEFVKDIAPTAEQGLTFCGWYEGDELLASDRKMPQGGLTLVAKYTAQYTAYEYLQNLDGTYPQTPTMREGSAIFGEEFTYTSNTAHFSVDSMQQNDLYRKALGKNETFTAYLQRDMIQVGFLPNVPAGASNNGGGIEFVYIIYGQTVTFPSGDRFDIGAKFRFAGWSDQPDGQVTYQPGDVTTPNPTGNVASYFARWEIGATDIFGGEDYVFLSLTEPNTVYLRRFGLEEKKGEYNPQTGVFIFRQDNEEVLSGKLLGDTFYYFKDALEQEYLAYGGTGEKLALYAYGQARYTNQDGAQYSGNYDVDPTTGNYLFKSDANTLNFTFRLVEGLGGLVFRIQGQEAGSYALVTNESGVIYPILTLDGFGGLQYVGEETQYHGYYLVDETAGEDVWYAIILDNYSQLVDYFNFILTNEGASLAGHGKIDGTFRMDDELGGSYATADSGSLVLDGFGSGTLNGAQGSYTAQYNRWYQLQSGQLSVVETVFLRFTTKGGSVLGTFLNVGGNTVFYVIPQGTMYGVYDFATGLTLDGILYTNAFAYLYGNGQVSVWVPYGVLTTGQGVYICIFSDGILTQNGSDYRIATEDGAYQIDVELRGGAFYPQEDGKVVDEGLIIDNNGDAWYNGVKVDYSYEPGVYYVYTFYIFSNEGSKYVFCDGQFVAVDQALYETVANPNRGEYILCMLQLRDGNVMVGVLTTGNYYAYVLYGKAESVDGGSDNEYVFTSTKNNAAADIAELYSKFRFRIVGDDEFELYDNAYDNLGGKLTTDGYGRGTYNGVDGTYFVNRNLLVFAANNGNVYRLLVDGQAGTVVETGNEAGMYTLYEGGEYYYKEYLFLDGNGNATVYMLEWYAQSDTFTDEYVLAYGTYTQAHDYAVDGFVEYCVTLPADTAFYGLVDGQLYVVVQRLVDDDGYEFGFFATRDMTQAGRFEIDGGGSVYSDGYNLDYATYVDANGTEHEGVMYLCDVLDGNYDSRGYKLNHNGKNVLFAVVNNGQVVEELVFDVLPGGKLCLRTQLYGAYAKVVDGERTKAQLYLDGHGNAIVYDISGAETARGQIEALTELDQDAWRFVDQNNPANSFIFRLYEVRQVGGSVYEYRLYTAEEDGVYVSDDAWWVLRLDGYGLASYIDRYGVVTNGKYAIVGGWLVVLYPDAMGADQIYFEITQDGKFGLVTAEFIVAEGALYAYQGHDINVTLPADVTLVKAGAFKSSKVEGVDLNKATRLEAEAFVGSRVKTVVGASLVEIGARAFYQCSSLASVNLPAAQVVGEYAFYECYMLRNVNFGAIRQIGAYAFAHREVYNDTLTMDLTAVANVNAIQIDPTAFDGIEEGETSGSIHLRILVNDIETVNAIYNGTAWPQGVRHCGALTYSDQTKGSYINFASGKLYAFVGGYLREMLAGSFDVTYGQAIGLYTQQGDNTLLYMLDLSGAGYNATPIAVQKVIAAEAYTLFALDETHTLATNRAEGDFAFTLTVRYVQNSLGYTFSFGVEATLGGQEFVGIRYHADLRVFFAQFDNEFLQIAVLSATNCQMEAYGSEVELETADGAFKVRLRLDRLGNPVELVSFQYLSNNGNWIARTVVELEIRPNGVLFATFNPAKPDYYVITYVNNGGQESVTVELFGETLNNVNVQGDYSTKATLVVKDGNIVDVKTFSYHDEWQEIASVVINSDGTATVTVSGGAQYKITLVVGRYSNYITVEVLS